MKRFPLTIVALGAVTLSCAIAAVLHVPQSKRVHVGLPSSLECKLLVSQRPVPGKITSVFGPRQHPVFKRRLPHQGMDFRARAGTPVRNVLDGVVVRAENAGGFGNAVFIYHPVARRISMYAHLSRMDVRVGEFTKQGEVVGLAGATGYATAAHLHFGVKNAKGAWVDPAEFLSQVADWQQVALANRTDLPQQTKLALAVGKPLAHPATARKYLAQIASKPAPEAPQMVASTSPSALNARLLAAMDQPERLLEAMNAGAGTNFHSHLAQAKRNDR